MFFCITRASIAGGIKIVYTHYVTKKADEVARMEQALEALRQRQQMQAMEQEMDGAADQVCRILKHLFVLPGFVKCN